MINRVHVIFFFFQSPIWKILDDVTLHWTQMADRILKFMIGHLGLGSSVQLDLVDFKVLCSANQDWF